MWYQVMIHCAWDPGKLHKNRMVSLLAGRMQNVGAVKPNAETLVYRIRT
jgi:hypothetical protein